jgi:virginiamycin B lyase
MERETKALALTHEMRKHSSVCRERRSIRFGMATAAGLFLLAALPATSLAQQPSFAEFSIPTGNTSHPQGITTGPDGAVWFVETSTSTGQPKIGRIDVTGGFKEYSNLPAGTQPQQIVAGPDGNLYFTGGNYIGQMTPAGVLTQFVVPLPNGVSTASTTGIAVGHDGNIWFAEAAPGVNAIGALSTSGNFSVVPGTPISIPTNINSEGSIPTWLTLGPDNNIWFTEQLGNKIGTVRSGAITEYSIPTANSEPFGIASDGTNLWFTERNTGKVAKITTGGTITEYLLTNPTTAAPLGITLGPDGAMWFTEEGSNKIGRITTGGTLSEYTIPTANSGAYAITEGPDRALWFTEDLAGAIGRISELSFESFGLIPGALTQVSIGADGSVWGINAGQQIYNRNFASDGWTNVPGSLKSISVGNANAVWGLNYTNQIYHLNASGTGWVNVPGELNQISVGADGEVWGINYVNNIYRYNGSGWTEVGGASSKLNSITVGSAGDVYGINSNGGVFWYNPGAARFEWLNGTLGYSQVAVGIDGDVWALNGGRAYHWDVLHNEFVATSLSSVSQLVVGSGAAVFALNSSDQVFQWDATSQTWVQLSGSLVDIAAGANGTVWGVSSSQQIYQLLGAPTRAYHTLTVVPGAVLDQISVGADGTVWGVYSGTVEYFNRNTQTFQAVAGAPPMSQVSVGAGNDVWGTYCPATGSNNCSVYEYLAGASPSWKLIPGELNLVQVGANGDVWGINSPGQTYYYDFLSSPPSWVNIPGSLGTLSVGADGTVWGINGFLQVYRYNGRTDGTVGSWQNIPGSLTEISVGNANDVWGINETDGVYTYDTTTSTWSSPAGASLDEVWTSFDGAVWGVNTGGNLYQWNGSSFAPIGPSGVATEVLLGNANNVWVLNETGQGAVYYWF